MSKVREKLVLAMRTRSLVRLSRRFEKWPIHGYVLGLSSQFVLVALVSKHIWFDGFECFRLADVRNAKPDPYASFVESALKKRRQRIPNTPHIDLTSTGRLIRAANADFPLITIHLEAIDPDVCYIGRAMKITRQSIALLHIRPDATWDSEPTLHRLNEITRISFGGDYEDALQLVAGPRARVT